MKTITILVATVLMSLTTTVETNAQRRGHGYYAIDYRNAEPIFFIERGISFYVLPNGEFDFNTERGYYGPRGGRNNINTTYGAPSRGRGIRIEHDFNGRVRRIGNVFINYDFAGRVKRIGSVYMSYNSFALTRVGGMRILYNWHGEIIDVIGTVNGYHDGYVYNPCPANYNYGNNNNWDNHGNHDDWSGNGNEEDFYYYRKDGKKEKMSTDDIENIRREKKELEKEEKRN